MGGLGGKWGISEKKPGGGEEQKKKRIARDKIKGRPRPQKSWGGENVIDCRIRREGESGTKREKIETRSGWDAQVHFHD